MKAILLAAGQGTRLRPLTDDRPKCMVEYRGTPLLHYQLKALRDAGIEDISIVTGYKAEKIEGSFQSVHHNARFAETNMVSTLFSAEAEFNDDLIISYTDIIYRTRIVEALIQSSEDFSVVVDKNWRELWESRMEDPLQDAETLKIQDGKIVELGKKPKSYEEIEGQYIGLFKISKDILPKVAKFYKELDRSALYDGKDFDNMYMTSFIQLIIDRLTAVYPCYIHGGWMEVDAAEDLNYDLPD